MRIVAGILTVLVSAPIWFYLQYQILVRVEASELMWFLFWVYLPISFLVQVIYKILEDN